MGQHHRKPLTLVKAQKVKALLDQHLGTYEIMRRLDVPQSAVISVKAHYAGDYGKEMTRLSRTLMQSKKESAIIKQAADKWLQKQLS